MLRSVSACSNRKRFYLDEIERPVVAGLRVELGTSEPVSYFVHCYKEERRRTASSARGARHPRADRHSHGQAVLPVDKHIDALLKFADRHVVIEKGCTVWTGTSAELAGEASVRQRYLQV